VRSAVAAAARHSYRQDVPVSSDTTSPTTPSFSLDLRLALPAAAAWLATAAGLVRPAHSTLTVAIVLATIAVGLLTARGNRAAMTAAATACCMAAALASAAAHLRMARPPVLTGLADAGATARVELVLTGDPVLLSGPGRPPGRSTVRVAATLVEVWTPRAG